MEQQRFKALSRLCLNNWHYIDRKILSFREGINFFTGHSGSGKSTVIDALQILLYADSDGRGFFNKAAADDSDRSLIEYLRGMVNIGEDNEYEYVRNRNFSTTIVMELRRTDTGSCQSIGVAFDVDTASNSVNSRLFFEHDGPLLENAYRKNGRAMTTEEIREELQHGFEKNQYFLGPSNERFRRVLYDEYLGGLNEKRFPQLFRRAIPFRMKIRLEEFVKEYICMEEDIRIEDMQESVMQYGRMRRKIGDTCGEIRELEKIGEAYGQAMARKAQKEEAGYFRQYMDLAGQRERVSGLQDKIEACGKDLEAAGDRKKTLEQKISDLEARRRELDTQIAASGYEELQAQLAGVNEMVERLSASRGKWQQTAAALGQWEEQDVTPNPVLWDIGRFRREAIQPEELDRLQKGIAELQKDAAALKKELDSDVRQLSRQVLEIEKEAASLRQGGKAYPKELEEARQLIRRRLQAQTGRPVQVEILADLLEIPDDTWRNAVEGYMGSNKLLLIVEPAYVRQAMAVYEELDQNKYYSAAVLDTEKVMAREHRVKKGALAEEVDCRQPHVRAYLDFLMGNVIKCADVDELREQAVGITSGCLLYQGYKLQRINPKQYTRFAYIGKEGRRRRIRQMEKEKRLLEEKLEPLKKQQEECAQVLALEGLSRPAEEYLGWAEDIRRLPEKQKEQKKLQKKLEELQRQDVSAWEQERDAAEEKCSRYKEERDELMRLSAGIENRAGLFRQQHLELSGQLAEQEQLFTRRPELEEKVQAYLKEKKQRGSLQYDSLRQYFQGKETQAAGELENAWSGLRGLRFEYLRQHPNRSFDPESSENQDYDQLLERLRYTDLETLYQKADEQAREAVELFKQDFVYKIRSAIKEAMERKRQLNQIIDRLDFGKDKYRFKFGKNKGPDGKYFDMFMAEDLEINPASLRPSVDHQMNLFAMTHENHYGELIQELISCFIPPDNATAEELEEAKRNMVKYADYRTYLSFDMEQIIEGEETVKIPLSKMLKKNSGGEGQNPLYVALLASFAQAYHIDLSARRRRDPSIRLVVLDEAFSKMDAEKVASCMKLIRGFGFQAIISATNDKIQNYLESVDKTFVFANPNKKHISIQEFEKEEFGELINENDIMDAQ